MVVAVISHLDHCKSHVKTLKKDGYEVVTLGPDPKEIPESVDLVVLRTDGCAHQGSDTAFAWAREGEGRPLIVENGVSGMKRELKNYFQDPESFGRVKFTKAYNTLREHRPNDTKEEVEAALREMGAPAQLVEFILGPWDLDVAFSELLEDEEPSWEGEPSQPYPSGEKWTKAVPEGRLFRELKATQKMWNDTPQVVRDEVRQMYLRALEGQPFTPKGEAASRQGWENYFQLQGRPIRFFLFLLKCLQPGDPCYRRDLEACYEQFTGKGTDARVIAAATWVHGLELLKGRKLIQDPEPEASPEPVVEKADLVVETDEPDEGGEPSKDPFKMVADLRSNFEDHVLDLMEKVSSLEEENRTLKKSLESLRTELRELVGAVKSDVTSAVQGLRIDLEDSRGDLKDQIQDLQQASSKLFVEPTSGSEVPDFYKTIDELRERGAKISISFDPVEI